MIRVKRKDSCGISNYFIYDENDTCLKVLYDYNGDLYFNVYSNKKEINRNEVFVISKENMYIYNAFDKLYQDIKDARVFEVDEMDLMLCMSQEEIDEEYRKINKMNEYLKSKFNYQVLFNNGVVTWISDDSIETNYEFCNALKIEKNNDKYILSFSFNDYGKAFSKSIRIANSGSRFDPFNIVMMRFYSRLKEYDPELHISDEAVNNHQKLKKMDIK